MKFFPDGYTPILSERETERAIKLVKDNFERELSGALRLSRVTSPLFVKAGSGINDDLNGVERPVSFEIGNMNNSRMEIVQSLAKWKRMALADYGIKPGFGTGVSDCCRIRNIESIKICKRKSCCQK